MPAIRALQPLPPMSKAEAGLVARSVEPALVTAEHLSIEGRGVDVLARRAGVSAQRRLTTGPSVSLRFSRCRAARNSGKHNADHDQKRTQRATRGRRWRFFGDI